MRRKVSYTYSINFKVLAIVFAGILLFAVILTIVSSYFIHSVFDSLYREKLSAPSRTLLAQHNYKDIIKYVDMLKMLPDFDEASDRYLEDRLMMAQIKKDHTEGAYPPAYSEAYKRIMDYIKSLSQHKDDKYAAFFRSLLNTQTSTGVKNLYILADIGLDERYVYIFNAFYEADVGAIVHDDLGTVVLKSDFPEIEKVYQTAEPVYVIDKVLADGNGKISQSFSPVTDGYGNIVGIICAEANLESVGEQLNQFLLLSGIITLSLSLVIMLLILVMLRRFIISPVNSLTSISSEISQGNLTVEIPKLILNRRDEMGVLSSSYESMRAALEKLIANNKSLFEEIIIGKLDTRADSSEFSGLFARLIDCTNETLDVIELYFDSLPASFVILDPDYHIVYSNDIFNKTFAALNEQHLYQELLEDPGEDLDALKMKFSEKLQQGEFNCLRWFTVGEEKRCFSFLCRSVEQGGNRNGAVIVINDNTELVLAKDKALSANRAKSEFLSRVSHELRTPLNAILSMAKLGLHDRELDQSVERFEKIVSSSAHLSNIINDVLEMSRMESGKTEIRYAPMNVAGLMRECVNMLLEKAAENGNRLLFDVDPDIPVRLSGDEFRIKQILLNLLSNAIKFTKDGDITVAADCIGRTESHYELRFTVTDTGIGMSPEFLKKVFTPFEQEDNFLSRRYAGSGLGLSISFNLVTLMGGTMAVESELGKGSRFVFTIGFDTVTDDATESAKDCGVPENELSIAGKRLLLVDDVEINRLIVVEVLADSGVEIDEASDGEEAVEKFQQSPPHYYNMILMDIQMPKMDGYKAAAAIRGSDREDRSIPIVAMTANALKEDIDRALESGMNGHLAKPIDFDLCINTVKKYCAQ